MRRTLEAQLTSLAQNLVRCAGRNPEGFVVSSTSDGGVCVCSNYTATYYPASGWTSKFSRHLHAGFFDKPALAQAAPAAARVS
jgi:hypothetical protein